MVASNPRVLVTGGAGYIGSWVVNGLLSRGYAVTCLDRLLFGPESLDRFVGNPNLELITADCRDRDVMRRAMSRSSTVMHLAGLVGDPACAVDETVSCDINVRATETAAQLAREAGARFIFASSCSVYGVSGEISDEQAHRAPVSTYARNKCEAEDILNGMIDDRFGPVTLRFATIHGLSPRPRFDLVVNLFAALATRTGAITVFGGDQWRPFVHCADVADALIAAVEAPEQLVCGETFNVGSDPENYRIRDLAELIAEEIPGTGVTLLRPGG
ncbi:MAG: NAD(P)-dependent oxidoreductase [Chloroflexota bacterium]